MKQKCTILTAFLLALLAGWACTEIEQQIEERTPIAFSAVVSGDMPMTRAVGMIDDDGALQPKGFGVFGCYTGLHTYSESDANASFMYNQKLTWNGTIHHWEYEPLKYWPSEEGHKVSFFAYAPYSDGTNECIPSFSLYQEKTDPWLLYKLADDPQKQVDLLYADPLLDKTKPAMNERLEFNFKHALACVGDKVRISLSTNVTGAFVIKLKKVTIDYTLTAKAKLILWNQGKANWSPVQSENVLTTRTVTLLSDGNETLPWENDEDHRLGIFCIPAEVAGYPQKATINVTYVVDYNDDSITDVERSTSAELTLKGKIQEGKVLDININLTPEE